MPDIQILSPHLADLIAAGEVVERPASVVKELVENAFDAGARTVTVELRGGGATYLRVTDDGCGMAPEDAGIAFLRHATSKLHDEQGLEAIGTMGFRGEALAAISAVSHITLTTRQRGAASGTHMTLDAGDIQDMYETGCPEGTTMIVRDLFFNTPARRLIQCSYSLLGLISFLTCGSDECRAWTITRGTKAPQAAGKIHSDFERGFIRAEIVAFDDLKACGSMAVAKEKGLVRSEGKDYVMHDGDVTLFRFNV